MKKHIVHTTMVALVVIIGASHAWKEGGTVPVCWPGHPCATMTAVTK